LKKLQKQQGANDNKPKEGATQAKESAAKETTGVAVPEKSNETANDKTDVKEEPKIESNDQKKGTNFRNVTTATKTDVAPHTTVENIPPTAPVIAVD